MLQTWQALLLGLLQGATELFPVSSLGHAVLLPTLLHWNYRQDDPTFVPFLTLLHLGTAGALIILFFKDWVRIVRGFIRAAVRGRIQDQDERLAMLLLVGTVPAGAVGLVLQEPLKRLFATPRAAAAFLIVNGAILLGAELLRRRAERRGAAREEQERQFKEASEISFAAAAFTGLAQSLALLPGISRSGVTMCGGLVAGLRHEAAARFSFLLATPIILAAGVLEVPQLFTSHSPLGTYALAAVLAGVAAYVSARFLIRYFRSGRLDPYGWYCLAAGAVSLVLLR
ncbi:MAG: undecaprenyl-diphosphate phosphatase [Candidatus Dormibacteraeota bacterium]|nr:undecaprenyl-diphosphate phosphatase [Candidatus Dormibacteraeota bacterium]